MATSVIELSNILWTKITDPGESGTCWKKTGGQVVVDHTDQSTAGTLPTASALVTVEKSKRAPQDEDNDNVLGIPADNASDIFYALSLSGLTDKIAVDVL